MEQFEYPFMGNSLKITHSPKGVVEITWQKKSLKSTPRLKGEAHKLAQSLKAYLAGKSDQLQLAVDWEHLPGTDFQKKVWKQMAKIPYGQTQTYSQLANKLSNPNGARAVGTACGKNPVLLVVPCHRVVGKSGLGGFSGGGLPVKRKLLQLEGHRADEFES